VTLLTAFCRAAGVQWRSGIAGRHRGRSMLTTWLIIIALAIILIGILELTDR
jgi:hypothetical protein